MDTKKKYQTISEFMQVPFNDRASASMNKTNKYAEEYQKEKAADKIKVAGICEMENSYYIHIRIPSKSHQDNNYYYDVVIRFFTDNPVILMQKDLLSYYMQFFSNSPGFIYKYAALYKKEGYLIESLYDKLDKDYIDKLPEQTNSDMTLLYDKTIYFACRFISDFRYRILNKKSMRLYRMKSPKQFFLDINDFKAVKVDQELMNVERSLKKKLSKVQQEKEKIQKEREERKKQAMKSTSKTGSSITYIVKKTGKNHIIKKKIASKSTRKR